MGIVTYATSRWHCVTHCRTAVLVHTLHACVHAGPLPTILAPHGGPHTAVTLGWYPAYAFLVSLGYAIILPNYR